MLFEYPLSIKTPRTNNQLINPRTGHIIGSTDKSCSRNRKITILFFSYCRNKIFNDTHSVDILNIYDNLIEYEIIEQFDV